MDIYPREIVAGAGGVIAPDNHSPPNGRNIE